MLKSYAPEAYRSDKLVSNSSSPIKRNCLKLGNAQDRIPYDFFKRKPIKSQILNDPAIPHYYRVVIGQGFTINHVAIQGASNRINSLPCWGLVIFGLFLIVKDYWDTERFSILLLIALAFIVFVGLVFTLLVKQFNKFKSPWELNRFMGCLLIHEKNNRQEPITTTIPFSEIAACIINRGSYYLRLMHDGKAVLDIHRPFLDGFSIKNDVKDTWDFLQNYMDTSKSLPDIPLLERLRQYDPMTKAYDEQQPRQPNYWSEMNFLEWRRQCKRIKTKRAKN